MEAQSRASDEGQGRRLDSALLIDHKKNVLNYYEEVTNATDRKIKCKTGWVYLNRTATQFIQFGLKSLVTNENEDPFLCQSAVVFVIPGNPGAIEMYKDFMEGIYERLKLPVIGLSHAGHAVPPQSFRNRWNKEPEKMYTLVEQINHKTVFWERYIPENVYVLLVGHSIGAYIALQMLDIFPLRKVGRCILIMPVIEYVYDSPNGQYYLKNAGLIENITLGAASFVQYLPSRLQDMIVKLGFFHDLGGPPQCCITGATNVCNKRCLSALFVLMKTVLSGVKETDFNIIDSNLNLLTFYYSDHDQWVPRRFYDRLASYYPQGDIQMMPWGHMYHQFYHNSEMTHTVVRAVVENISKAFLSVPDEERRRAFVREQPTDTGRR